VGKEKINRSFAEPAGKNEIGKRIFSIDNESIRRGSERKRETKRSEQNLVFFNFVNFVVTE
jgi:hypothetical protein